MASELKPQMLHKKIISAISVLFLNPNQFYLISKELQMTKWALFYTHWGAAGQLKRKLHITTKLPCCVSCSTFIREINILKTLNGELLIGKLFISGGLSTLKKVIQTENCNL